MQVYECNFKVYLLKNISMQEIQESLSKLIDKSFYIDKDMENYHYENKMKGYCFNSLYPLESDGIYKEGNIYNFQIRCISEKLKDHFIKILTNEYTSFIKILTSEFKVILKKPIQKLYSITPLIIKIPDNNKTEYWRNKHNDIEFFEYIRKSCIKKYEVLNKEVIDKNLKLFSYERIDNGKPITSDFKSKKILGDKVTLELDTDEISQNIAYMLIGTGIADMCPRGYGYLNYQYIR